MKDEKKNKLDVNKIFNRNNISLLIKIFFVFYFIGILFLLYVKRDNNIDMPIVYSTKSNLHLIMANTRKENQDKPLVADDNQSIIYSNTNGRYVLYKDGAALYLFDTKIGKANELLSMVNYYNFTSNDKRVVMTDVMKNLYVFDMNKKEGFLLDSEVITVYNISNDYVLYKKDDDLYVANLNTKENEIIKISDNYTSNIRFNKEGNKIYFLNNESEFIEYSIKDKKMNTIDENVKVFYCKKECDSYYYLIANKENDLKYYDGKSKNIDNSVTRVVYYDSEEKQVAYIKAEDEAYYLYYKYKKVDPIKVDEIDNVKDLRAYKDKYVYYLTDNDELRYVEAKKGQESNYKILAENVSGYLYSHSDGCSFIANVDEENKGTLFIATKDKVKEIDTEVANNLLFLNEKQNKIYYFKNFGTTGDLYVSSGKRGNLIDQGIYDYQYVNDKLIYYIKDYSVVNGSGSLYIYTNKARKVAENVTKIIKNENLN